MSEVYIPVSIQKEVKIMANGYCEYCLYPERFSSDFFHFDHIVSLFEGGTTELSNIARCCGYCNGFKKAKTYHFDPKTGQITALFNPRKSLWTEHFQWSDDDLLILGRTDIGRATIELLQLNRQNVVNLRQILRKNGEHPPKFSMRKES